MQGNRIGSIRTWIASELFTKGSLESINASKTGIQRNVQDVDIFIPQFESSLL